MFIPLHLQKVSVKIEEDSKENSHPYQLSNKEDYDYMEVSCNNLIV